MPRFSPDGKWIAFERNSQRAAHRSIRLRRPRSCSRPARSTRRRSSIARDFDWSPDSRYIAYLDRAAKNVPERAGRSVRRGGGEAKPVELPREHERRIAVVEPRRDVPDCSHRRSAPSRAQVDSRRSRSAHAEVPRGPVPRSLPATSRPRRRPVHDLSRRNDRRRRTRRRPTPRRAGARPSTIVFDDIRRRASVAARSALDVAQQSISPDGKWLLLTARGAGQQNLYVYSLDELSKEPAVARQLTSTAGPKRNAQFSPDSKEVYYLDRGQGLQRDAREARAEAIAVDRGARRRFRAREDRGRSTRRGRTCATTSSTRR